MMTPSLRHNETFITNNVLLPVVGVATMIIYIQTNNSEYKVNSALPKRVHNSVLPRDKLVFLKIRTKQTECTLQVTGIDQGPL